MTDQTPRTDAGRRLLFAMQDADDAHPRHPVRVAILAIEDEAAAQARTEALDVLRLWRSEAVAARRLAREDGPGEWQTRAETIEAMLSDIDRAILAGGTE